MTDQIMETVTEQHQETVMKQKNTPRTEQGKKLVEYNHHKKEELKHLNEQITKQDGTDHKPKPYTNNYVYVGGLSLFGLAISGYLLYSKLKKPEQNLIDVPPASNIYRAIFTHCISFTSPLIHYLQTSHQEVT